MRYVIHRSTGPEPILENIDAARFEVVPSGAVVFFDAANRPICAIPAGWLRVRGYDPEEKA